MKTQCKSWILVFNDSNSLITSLCIEYKGEVMTLNLKAPVTLFLCG